MFKGSFGFSVLSEKQKKMFNGRNGLPYELVVVLVLSETPMKQRKAGFFVHHKTRRDGDVCSSVLKVPMFL